MVQFSECLDRHRRGVQWNPVQFKTQGSTTPFSRKNPYPIPESRSRTCQLIKSKMKKPLLLFAIIGTILIVSTAQIMAAPVPSAPDPDSNPPVSYAISLACHATGSNVVRKDKNQTTLMSCTADDWPDGPDVKFNWSGTAVAFISTGPRTAFVYCNPDGHSSPLVTVFNGNSPATSSAVASIPIRCSM